MSVYVGGYDCCNSLGIDPTVKSSNDLGCVDAATRVPFDLMGAQCISGGQNHSVIIKHGKVFAAGDDYRFIIGSSSRQSYKTFTEVKISDEPISWTACGNYFTLYLTAKGKVILCHEKAVGERIQVKIAKKAVSVLAGYHFGSIIDEEGAIYIIDIEDPHKTPQRIFLGVPVVDFVECGGFMCALTADGRVFSNGILNYGSKDFAENKSLKGKKIVKISGWANCCAVLTNDGRVFTCGLNSHGELGNEKLPCCSTTTFKEVLMNEEIKDVSCSEHTLFLTKSNKVFGCGNNIIANSSRKQKKKDSSLLF